MTLEPCLVYSTLTGQWRVEDRPPVEPSIPPQFDWSSELERAAKRYRRLGEDTQLKKRRRAQFRRRREMAE